jgi:hypothetical protein
MARNLRTLALVLLLVFLTSSSQPDVSRANPSGQPDKTERDVVIKKNKIIIRGPASEVIYRKGFFPPDQCNTDEGLFVFFKDGKVAANVKDKLVGATITSEAMTFRIGNTSCQIVVEIRKYASGD